MYLKILLCSLLFSLADIFYILLSQLGSYVCKTVFTRNVTGLK